MRQIFLTVAVLCLASPVSFAQGFGPIPYDQIAKTLPICRDNRGQAFEFNDDVVLKWKTSTRNNFQDRGFVVGRIVKVLQNESVDTKKRKSGHWHAEVDISPSGSDDMADHIEVIYNSEFGPVTNAQPGDIVTACGDYITSNAPSGHYPASPMGGLVHWIHASNNPEHHPAGFLTVGGKLYGYQGDAHGQQPEMPDDQR